MQGHRLVGSAKPVGWDQRRFAAPAHQDFSTFPDGGPALEASWSHPTLNKAMALVLVQRLCRCLLTCALVCLTFCLPALAEEFRPWRVDFNPNDDRRDVLSRHADNWRVVPAESISKTIGNITVTLRRVGHAGTRLTWGWWKAGLDSGATFASDGVTVENGESGGSIEMTIRGLAPGKHSIVTWHNAWDASGQSPFSVAVNGVVQSRGIRPSLRAAHDDDAATHFVEVVARAGEDVVLRFTPDAADLAEARGNIVINGFAMDVPDPARQARKPEPADDDEHVVEQPQLRWTASKHAVAQHVYFGTSREAVDAATPLSPEFRGTLECPVPSLTRSVSEGEGERSKKLPNHSVVERSPSLTLRVSDPPHSEKLDPFSAYFWRVDSVDRADPRVVTKGNVWRFKVRRLAFPGAEGYGRFAAGGRGGRVIEVTNLDDSGPGSLRDAVDTEGPRTVVFRVGGTITLKSKLVIRNPYLTLAGQTAPGDGICLRGFTVGCLGAHDVILRYLRIRVGDEAQETMDGTGFASSDHCIMDHCSVSWSIDEAVSSRGAGNITVQRCLIAEALNIANHKKYQPGKGHSFAASISGNVGSFHHNLLAHCAGRNWSLAGGLNRGGQFAGRLDIRNNVVFNWEHRTTDGGAKAVNFVNNFYLPGPATRVFHLVKPDAGSPTDPQQYFISGNAMAGRPQYDADNWANGGVIVDAALIPRIRLTEPFCESHVTTTSAIEAHDSVLQDVGANFPQHDTVDLRVLKDVKHRRATSIGSRGRLPGIIDSQADIGGWPELRSGTPPTDTDHDGLPDDWERSHGLNPNDATDAASDTNSDGFTELESYLNGIVAGHVSNVPTQN